MINEQEKYTKPIKNLGYTISYEFTSDMFVAYVHYPWEKKDDASIYSQTTLTDFYKNLHDFVMEGEEIKNN